MVPAPLRERTAGAGARKPAPAFTRLSLLIGYDGDMDQKTTPSPAEEQQDGYKPRRTTRHRIDEPTNLQPQNLIEIEVKVRDVSARGFMAECHEPVRIGSYVSLDVPGIGPVHAQVRWQIGSRMGGMFLDPISLARCEWRADKAAAKGDSSEAA